MEILLSVLTTVVICAIIGVLIWVASLGNVGFATVCVIGVLLIFAVVYHDLKGK